MKNANATAVAPAAEPKLELAKAGEPEPKPEKESKTPYQFVTNTTKRLAHIRVEDLETIKSSPEFQAALAELGARVARTLALVGANTPAGK
jgi:hypothetical protein